MEPEVGRASPRISFSVVVLPAPLGPISAKVSPGSTENERPSTAVTAP